VTDPLPEFPYHPDPVATGSVEESDALCMNCGRRRGFIYVGPVYATDELAEALCPWCIADGSAAARFDASFTDVAELPDDVPAETIVRVMRRTPGFTGWQQEHWMFHCGDGAAFLGRADQDGGTAYRFRCLHCGAELSYSDSP
jgi:uncharacterized protein CbrC (UPF0167 family)